MKRVGLAFALLATFGSEITPRAASLDDVGSIRRVELGIGLRFMPVGWFNLSEQSGRSFRAYPALGGQAFLDYRLTPVLNLGLGGEITGNVIPNRSEYVVGTMYAATLRLGARYPTQGRFEPYGTVTAGYSMISPSPGSSSARGPLVGGWGGGWVKLGEMNKIFGEVGYERGFQTVAGAAYAPSYLVTELGWMVAF
jgi:opacity protein-like surface antigen